jgi:hypothetical protein
VLQGRTINEAPPTEKATVGSTIMRHGRVPARDDVLAPADDCLVGLLVARSRTRSLLLSGLVVNGIRLIIAAVACLGLPGGCQRSRQALTR